MQFMITMIPEVYRDNRKLDKPFPRPRKSSGDGTIQ